MTAVLAAGASRPERGFYDELVHTADGMIVLVSSFGCGRADTLAASLGMPRLRLRSADEPSSGVRGADHLSTFAEATYGSLIELDETVQSWLVETHPEMAQYRARHAREIVLSESERTGLLRRWEMLEEREAQRVAARAGLQPRLASEILMDPARFAALATGRRSALASDLDVGRQVGAGTNARSGERVRLLDVLSSRERASFERAESDGHWTVDLAIGVLREGVARLREAKQLSAAGQPARFSLNTPSAWRRLLGEI